MGLTSARCLVLATSSDGPVIVAQIGRMLGITVQSVQRVADLLTEDGLVAYAENPAHRRAKLVRLMPNGKRTLKAIRAAQTAWGGRSEPDSARGTSVRQTRSRRALATLSQRQFDVKSVSSQ